MGGSPLGEPNFSSHKITSSIPRPRPSSSHSVKPNSRQSTLTAQQQQQQQNIGTFTTFMGVPAYQPQAAGAKHYPAQHNDHKMHIQPNTFKYSSCYAAASFTSLTYDLISKICIDTHTYSYVWQKMPESSWKGGK
jgi:hypothetical protein